MATNDFSASGKPLRIAQITDMHLYADPDGQLLGLNTRRSLELVIDLMLSTRKPDLVVASGDLTHDASPQAYLQVRKSFKRIQAPVYCLPGNHDEAQALRACMNDDCFHSVRSECVGGWQLLFLDSTVAGSEGGHLREDELSELDTALSSLPDLPALVWLHHQPVRIGSQWLDTMAIDNPQPFFEIIDKHPQVRAIIWGHVHQTFEQKRNDVHLLAAPSTCVQFLPESEIFSVDLIPPGYRWLELHPDGTLRTEVERLQQIPGTIDLTARGY